MNGRMLRKADIDTKTLYKSLDEFQTNLGKIANVVKSTRDLSENQIKYYAIEAQANIGYINGSSNGNSYLTQKDLRKWKTALGEIDSMFKKATDTGKNLIKESNKVNDSLKKLQQNIAKLIKETDEKNEEML